MNRFTSISIIPIESFRDQQPTTFGEVVAYLNGLADALNAQTAFGRPISLMPVTIPSLLPGSPRSAPARITLRFGELPFERASVWPHVVIGPPDAPTRGGSRTLDLGDGEVGPIRSSWPAAYRHTLPYDAPSVSLAPRISIAPTWVDERSSEIRLRAGRLSVEWYELTGSSAANT